jgi:hypothetical protein
MVRGGKNLNRFANRIVERLRISAPGLHGHLEGLMVHLQQQAFDSTFWAEQQALQVTAQAF